MQVAEEDLLIVEELQVPEVLAAAALEVRD
jgi:hypothetical protein